MRVHLRQLGLVLIGQAGCVAVGLWFFGAQISREFELTSSTTVRMFLLGLITFGWVSVFQGLTLYLVTSRWREVLRHQNVQSANDTLRQLHQLVRAQEAVIFALAKLADSRDPETGHHLERITTYSRILAEATRQHSRFRTDITPEFVRLIHLTAALHDIGKVGIEDYILQKPGPLTPDEQKQMERHTLIAAECIDDIVRRVGPSPLLQMAREIAASHHERWDGTGYPLRLRGENIPIAARIVAIADVYDALASRRTYKEALGHDHCIAAIRDAAGGHFDPDLVEAWLTVEGEFAKIAARYTKANEMTFVPDGGGGEVVTASPKADRPVAETAHV